MIYLLYSKSLLQTGIPLEKRRIVGGIVGGCISGEKGLAVVVVSINESMPDIAKGSSNRSDCYISELRRLIGMV